MCKSQCPGIWISFFQQTVDKSLTRWLHSLPEVFTYPFPSWEVQLAILQGEQGGFFVRGADETFQFKVLHYERDISRVLHSGLKPKIKPHFDALTSAKSIVWRLNTYSRRLACACEAVSGLDGKNLQTLAIG